MNKYLLLLALSLSSIQIFSQDNIHATKFVVVTHDTLGYDSLYQVFYDNGKLFFQVPYRNGKMNGWYEQYHANGYVCIKELRVNDYVVDGYNIAYWDNGKISQIGRNKNGHEVGKWYHYTTEGRQFVIYYYDRKGNPKKVKEWDAERKKWVRTGFY